ncbi:MAG: hypothetical protein D6710_08255 [Nitrospirae bacterium]|nr:MAG: hypothetical protein D6710_08255 [Nitrospirota bacterium]
MVHINKMKEESNNTKRKPGRPPKMQATNSSGNKESEEKVVTTSDDNDTTSPIGVVGSLAGQIVSINMKQGPCWGIRVNEEGKTPVFLSPEQWYAKLPDDLTIEEEGIVNKAIQSGQIVLGKKWLPAITKGKGVKERYLAIVERNDMLTPQVKQPFIDLVKKQYEEGWTALEILVYCKEQEMKKRSRVHWLAFLQEAINNYSGPVQLVQDFPDDPENYEVTIDPVTKTVVSDSRNPEPQVEPPAPPTKADEEKLKAFLE